MRNSLTSCLVAFLAVGLVVPRAVRGQSAPPIDPANALQSITHTLDAGSGVRFLYTGRTMGHYRIPDSQNPDNVPDARCVATKSVAAQDFELALQDSVLTAWKGQTVLVGAGDNFAPELEARNFCKPPNATSSSMAKQDYSWDQANQKWCFEHDVKPGSNVCDSHLEEILATGMGIIPSDNVARFFIDEEYAALVPGKHDFYFGAERLRQVARFLASTPIPGHARSHLDSVQMLGANLVIGTNWKKPHKTLPDIERAPWFIPRYPTVQDLLGRSLNQLDNSGLLATGLKFTGVSDGGTVYPWFMGVSVQVTGPDPNGDVVSALKGASAFICPSNKEADPNQLTWPLGPPNGQKPCSSLLAIQDATGDGAKFQFRFAVANTSNLSPGGNYGFCLNAPQSDLHDGKSNDSHFYCVRFSVDVPLLQSTWGQPISPIAAASNSSFKEPEPYVLLPGTHSAPSVAIFGALDPHLTEYVGILNTSWSNEKKRYLTAASVKDPAEALRQLLEYFDAQHPEFKDDSTNMEGGSGDSRKKVLKVLLAQMGPQAAQILATRLGKFDVVVSAD
jgi:hypothetical protein